MTTHTTNKGLYIAVFCALAFAGMLIALRQDPQTAKASPSSATAFTTATTSTAVAVTSSTRILATTTSITGPSYTRVYATICNPSTTVVYINMNRDRPASASASVAQIAAAAGYNSCFEITDRNLYQGSVTASSTNQTSTSVIVTDYVY